MPRSLLKMEGSSFSSFRGTFKITPLHYDLPGEIAVYFYYVTLLQTYKINIPF